MNDMLKEALELVKAQATVRAMTADEMANMVSSLAKTLKGLSQPVAESVGAASVDATKVDSAKSIRDAAVTCLECGKVFKIITAKHLSLHGMDADAYRGKWGIKKGTPLACKALVRARRKKMKEMQLWERRRSAAGAKTPAAAAASVAAAAKPAKAAKGKGGPKKA